MPDSTALVLDKSLLWRISGCGLTLPSYLFGTWHGPGVNDLDNVEFLGGYSGFEQAFAGAEVFMPETTFEFDESVEPDFGDQMDCATLLPEDVCYEDLLDEQGLLLLDAMSRRYLEIGAHDLRYKPLYLMFLIEQKMEMSHWPSDDTGLSEKVMDWYLLRQAQQAGKEVVGLESAENHWRAMLALFDRPLKEQLDDLRSSCDIWRAGGSGDNQTKELIGKLKIAYLESDLETVEGLIAETAKNQYSPSVYNSMERVMVHDRNRAWIPVIEGVIADRSAFIAIGARHLPGKYGLVNLLRQSGYTVEPAGTR